MASSQPASLENFHSVLSIQEIIKGPMISVPQQYVLPDQENPTISVCNPFPTIPTVDLKLLVSTGTTALELEKLHSACKEWGIFQILSNGIYTSIEHRATVNSEKERISIAFFVNPKFEAEVGPATSLINPQNPPKFGRKGMEQYFKEFFALRLNGKSYLEHMKIKSGEATVLDRK